MLFKTYIVFLSLVINVAASGAIQSRELTGILTQIAGAVQLTGPGVGGVPLASPWQVIQSGVTARLPEGSAVGIACSSRYFVRLRGPASWTLTESSCSAGRELTAGEYALVAPQAGRFKVVEGLLTLEREIRGGEQDDLMAPIVLTPRNTVLRSPRPSVSWVRVSSAVEYRVEWSGRGCSYITRLPHGGIVCAAGPDGVDICTLPWAADRPGLAPDEIFFLSVAARGDAVGSWHGAEPVKVRTQKVSDSVALEGHLRHLEDLGLNGATLDVARAGLLAEGGLYADAAEDYRRAFTAAPTLELRVTLADLELAMGLFTLAVPHYCEAMASISPSVRAAAAFGLGRIEYARGRFHEAELSFRQARELYSRQGLSEEEAAARHAVERAAARAPQ